MASYINYANQGATRNLPLDPELANALSFLQDMGLTAQVFSGGQPAIGSGLARVGSTRHDHGKAADVFFMQGDRRLDWSNPQDLPIFQDVVRRGRAAGLTGFGAGPGYMQPGSMHIGFGNPGVWGAGGKSANAPDWLRAAFEGGAGAPTPQNVTPGNAMASAQPQGGQQAPKQIADMFAPPTGAPAQPPMQPPTLASLALAAFQPNNNSRRQQADSRASEEAARRTALLSSIGDMYA